jgi:[FeFe] hydrogenase H-cluster maturation GTPase HydF
MGLNDTPAADRAHIGFFGCRNAGKSSVVNAVTGQELSVVSNTKGTTTDPVYKTMEILPLGPVVIMDTPGFDDTGGLGSLRVRRTLQVLNRADAAVLVVDAAAGMNDFDRRLVRLFREKQIPYLTAFNKSDLLPSTGRSAEKENEIYVSAVCGDGMGRLKEKIASLLPPDDGKFRIVGDLIRPSDFVVLVTPIDKAAPKGRLILPQQQTIRDILDSDAAAVVVKEYQLRDTLEHLGRKPALVITDSQVFAKASAETPQDVPLTSFSILMARAKGFLADAVEGVAALGRLRDGDTVLMAEGCTHHRQCGDIGTVKIPGWLRGYTGKKLNFQTCSGGSFPEDLSPYSLVIHCGACMLQEREVRCRVRRARDQKVPITNYGIAIAYMQGILKRSLQVFPDLLAKIDG